MGRKKSVGRAYRINEDAVSSYSMVRNPRSYRANPMGVTSIARVNGRSARTASKGRSAPQRASRARTVMRANARPKRASFLSKMKPNAAKKRRLKANMSAAELNALHDTQMRAARKRKKSKAKSGAAAKRRATTRSPAKRKTSASSSPAQKRAGKRLSRFNKEVRAGKSQKAAANAAVRAVPYTATEKKDGKSFKGVSGAAGAKKVASKKKRKTTKRKAAKRKTTRSQAKRKTTKRKAAKRSAKRKTTGKKRSKASYRKAGKKAAATRKRKKAARSKAAKKAARKRKTTAKKRRPTKRKVTRRKATRKVKRKATKRKATRKTTKRKATRSKAKRKTTKRRKTKQTRKSPVKRLKRGTYYVNNRSRGYRKNGMQADLMSVGRAGFFVTSGFVAHRIATSYADEYIAPMVTNPTLARFTKPAIGFGLGVGGILLANQFMKNNGDKAAVGAGIATSWFQHIVSAVLLQVNQPGIASRLEGYGNSRAYAMRGVGRYGRRGMRGLGANEGLPERRAVSTMPQYARLGQYQQAAAGTGEYFSANGVGEYFASNGMQGVGHYEPAGPLAMQGTNNVHEIDDGIRPDSDLDSFMTLAESAAGVNGTGYQQAAAGIGQVYQAAAGGGLGEFFGAQPTNGGFRDARVPQSSQWIPNGPNWAGERKVGGNIESTELPAGTLESAGGNGVLSG